MIFDTLLCDQNMIFDLMSIIVKHFIQSFEVNMVTCLLLKDKYLIFSSMLGDLTSMLHNEVENDHNVSDPVCIATSQWLEFFPALVCGDRDVCCVAKSSLLHRFLIKVAAA